MGTKFLKKEVEYLKNILISKDFLDTLKLIPNLAIGELESKNSLSGKAELFDYYLNQKDVINQTELRTDILVEDNNSDFITLSSLEMEIASYSSTKEAFKADPALKQQMQQLKVNAVKLEHKFKANAYLMDELDSVMIDTIYYYPLDGLNRGDVDNQTDEVVLLPSQNPVYVQIYPNPATGFVNLDFQNTPDGLMEVQFIDLTGKIVYSNSFENSNGEQIDISDIQKGLYLVKVLIDKQIVEIQKLEVK